MNSQGQNIGYNAQMKQSSHSPQEALDRLSESQSNQNNDSYASQASHFLQEKGDQVINMAQGAGDQVKSMAYGAADAVKTTLGMTNETPGDYTRANVNNPTNPSTRV